MSRLTEEIKRVVNSDVLPAYRHFADFVANDYAPRGRTTVGLNSLPDGARRYQQAIREQTTTDMSPAEIHALGLRRSRTNQRAVDRSRSQSGLQRLEQFSRRAEW